MSSLLALIFCLTLSGAAQTIITGDALIGDRLSVGTTTAGGRILVQASSATQIPFQVSGVDETPFFRVEKDGNIGLSLIPQANLDLFGMADSADAGLQLRNGNLYPASSSNQITLGYNGTTNLRHALRTIHSTATTSNELDFLMWTPSVSTTAVGNLRVLTLQTTAYGMAVQVDPVAELADADLEISNGSSIGGGSMLSSQESVPSSRAWKTDIARLFEVDEAAALRDVLSLRHVRYRYKSRKGPKPPLLLGLMYDEVPESIKGSGGTIVFDERLNNTEMALKELIRLIDGLETRTRR